MLSGRTASDKEEEGGDDVKSAWPLCPGLHAYYNGWYSGVQDRKVERILKTSLSSDWGLQPDPMKAESLVIVDQHATVNTFPGLVHTARHTMKARNTRRSRLPGFKVELVIGVKS